MPILKSSSPKKTGIKKTSSSPKKRSTVRHSSKRTTKSKKETSQSVSPIPSPATEFDHLSLKLETPEYESKNIILEDDTETAYTHTSTHHMSEIPSRMRYQKTIDYAHELLPTKNQLPQRGKGALIAGVVSLLAVIGIFWVWNLTTHFSNITFAAGSDGRLLQDTKTTWQKNFTATNDTLSKSDIGQLTNAITSLANTSTPSAPITNTTVTIISSPTTTSSTISSTPTLTTGTTTVSSTPKPPKSPDILPPSKPRRR